MSVAPPPPRLLLKSGKQARFIKIIKNCGLSIYNGF